MYFLSRLRVRASSLILTLSFAICVYCSTPIEASETGIVGVTHGIVDAAIPPSTPDGQDWRYGLGLPIQLDAVTGGLLVNIRQNGTQYCDLEVGTDLIKFTSLEEINAANAIPVSRHEKEPNPWTGIPSVTSKYPMTGGFVPYGAKLSDGSPHPYAGTGFGICMVGFYPADPSQPLPSRIGYHLEIQQLAYDGKEFTASTPVRFPQLAVGKTGWRIAGVGISPAITDGADLLYPVTCLNSSEKDTTGVARFQYGKDGWQPVSFVSITNSGSSWFEPSLVCDVDDSLLFTARCDASSPITLWGSADGRNWKRLIHIDNARAYAPVVLNQATDGTPFLVTTTAASLDRNVQEIIPINSKRDGLEPPIVVRNGLTEFGPGPTIKRKKANQFGPAPNKRGGWHIDHGTGNIVRLADGRWHSIITYRVDAQAEHFGQSATPFTGHYVEEVSSSSELHITRLNFESKHSNESTK